MRTATNLAFWPTLLGSVVVVLMAPLLLGLFGSGFADQAHLTGILALGFIARGFVGPAELYLNVVGEQRACAVVLLAAAASNVALNIALIPWIGLEGAAVATTISLIVMSTGLYVLVLRRMGISLRPTLR